ncbi:hypothetical protein GCM10011349_44530 [Novosphingobium indicum]|uniref:Glutathione S-transferase n=1 Tax=Novosphingobium indicum TaxID=462949 RepID=A0ABQ2JZ47_9SPHN|nr:hypothetical protein [Novosphingobium indicum]GGN61671.1 hypothetical protein GCM10011349_44530 [Novosphingobium indicum]
MTQFPAAASAGADYVSVAEAKALSGLRLVLNQGVPGPWGEAAKGLFYVKGLSFQRVAQMPGASNAELKEWTDATSAPVAVMDGEPASSHWSEIVLLAERLQPAPALVPADQAERTAMFGLLHEICGQDGFAWNRRIRLFHAWQASLAHVDDPAAHGSRQLALLQAKYGYGSDEARARQRIVSILEMLGARLRAQADAGSGFFIGGALTALDIYWACFCAMIEPLPVDKCPMTRAQRIGYLETDPEILAAVDPILLEHRDRIYDTYLELPMRF